MNKVTSNLNDKPVNDALVIIPTYNEKENIELIIRAVFALKKDFSVLVVDDNSPDGTAKIVTQLQKEFPQRLFIENRKEKQGLGVAYIHGFKWALKAGYEYIIEMDADFSHNPNDLPRLYKACADEKADVAVGSRYVDGINVVHWDIKRILLSYFASKYVRIITGIPVKDTTAGFVCYKRNVLETIDLNQIKFVGYAFQIEMKFKAWKHGFSIREVSIIFTDRIRGNSKMNSSIISEAIFGVLKMKIDGLPKKIEKCQNC
jgi:dolichol-phosphate mannosyltransferase